MKYAGVQRIPYECMSFADMLSVRKLTSRFDFEFVSTHSIPALPPRATRKRTSREVRVVPTAGILQSRITQARSFRLASSVERKSRDDAFAGSSEGRARLLRGFYSTAPIRAIP